METTIIAWSINFTEDWEHTNQQHHFRVGLCCCIGRGKSCICWAFLCSDWIHCMIPWCIELLPGKTLQGSNGMNVPMWQSKLSYCLHTYHPLNEEIYVYFHLTSLTVTDIVAYIDAITTIASTYRIIQEILSVKHAVDTLSKLPVLLYIWSNQLHTSVGG